MKTKTTYINELLNFYLEDLGDGDITTESIIENDIWSLLCASADACDIAITCLLYTSDAADE